MTAEGVSPHKLRVPPNSAEIGVGLLIALPLIPLLPTYKQGTGNKNRRISSRSYTNNQC